MAGNTIFIAIFIGCLINNVSAIYFPLQIINVTLPSLKGLPVPLPPLVTVNALHGGKSGIIYGVRGGNEFHLRRNEIYLRQDLPPSPNNGGQQLEVFAKGTDGKTASAVVNVVFTDRRLVCEEFKKEMCFWTDGNFRINHGEDATLIGYLSSQFLLNICTNYSVTYRIESGGDYFAVTRMKNTNADSWALLLVTKMNAAAGTVITGQISCSVSSDNAPPTVYGENFRVSVTNESIGAKTPKHLEIMSLVVPNRDKSEITLSYPESVVISKFAQIASRVANPEVKSITEIKSIKKIITSGIKFRIEPDDVFGVTEYGGIAYVRNPIRLRNETFFMIRIIWSYPSGFVADRRIVVNVVGDKDGSACESKIGWRNKKSCSQRIYESDCLKTCGVGTGLLISNESGSAWSSGCRWRSNERPEKLSTAYITCSPDFATCPDRFCDPLEKMFPELCPQDCAGYVHGSGNKDLGEPGISSGSGVCSCLANVSTCTCGVIFQKKNQAANSEQCGIACLFSVFGGTVLLICIFSTFFMVLYHRRLKKRCPNPGPLKEDMININYEECIDRTTDSLRIPAHNPILNEKPHYYDKKWEFPRYRLTVEETIGEGEFGKVLKARAEGIAGIDGSTVVAVKTLKENARDSELNDLISEYQLLKEVDHPNIIHLLGACTTLDGPLYLIIEYAKHGSLRNYLRRHRHFGPELHLTDKYTEIGYMESITPKDILTFAWQIAKGMAYLTEMKLVHRDLAARNVLVAEGLICKISDFGLTRDIYEDDTYLKRSKGRVPVKWMALESLSDHVYTSKSDVWSYGIVLWELVTTGASPYPGIAVQNLFHLLKSGYRMERPVNCSPELYLILRSCWHENPSQRPTFKSLVTKLEDMLGEGKDYLDLNPRIIENKTYFTDFPNDPVFEESLMQETCDDGRGFMWKFDFSEGKNCNCTVGNCSCPRKVRYENEGIQLKPKYENDGVEDCSYVQPKGEPKPVNSVVSPNLNEKQSEKVCDPNKV